VVQEQLDQGFDGGDIATDDNAGGCGGGGAGAS
jgi:hypothetical protein